MRISWPTAHIITHKPSSPCRSMESEKYTTPVSGATSRVLQYRMGLPLACNQPLCGRVKRASILRQHKHAHTWVASSSMRRVSRLMDSNPREELQLMRSHVLAQQQSPKQRPA